MKDLASFVLNKKPLTEQEEKESKEDVLKRIEADSELTSFLKEKGLTYKEVENSLIPLISYMDDKEKCSKCRFFSSCPKGERKGFIYQLKYDPFSSRLELCSTYCQKFLNIKKILSRFIYSDFDPMEAYEAFGLVKNSGVKGSKQENSFLSAIKSGFEAINNESESENILFQDKTVNSNYLLKSMAFSAAKSGKTVALIDSKRTLNDCLSLNEEVKKDASDSLKKALDSQCLFIFNLGSEYKSSSFRDQILIPILQDRNSPKKITFISTALNLDLLIKSYSKKDSGMDEQLSNFFNEMFEIVNVEDFSYF